MARAGNGLGNFRGLVADVGVLRRRHDFFQSLREGGGIILPERGRNLDDGQRGLILQSRLVEIRNQQAETFEVLQTAQT